MGKRSSARNIAACGGASRFFAGWRADAEERFAALLGATDFFATAFFGAALTVLVDFAGLALRAGALRAGTFTGTGRATARGAAFFLRAFEALAFFAAASWRAALFFVAVRATRARVSSEAASCWRLRRRLLPVV